jgi:hypothetical protein
MNVTVVTVTDITNPVELAAWFTANPGATVMSVQFVQGLFYIYYQ